MIEYLRQNPGTQFGSILQFGIEEPLKRSLSGPESQALLEIVHEFMVSNIIMPNMNSANTGWPWISVTSHGRQVLSQGGPPVYDYDGYMQDLRSRTPGLDDVVQHYVSESLRAYQGNLYFASMVMLGCASERAVMLLMNAYVDSIDDQKNREKLGSRLAKRDISEAYSKFRQSFDSTKNQINSSELVEDFDVHVDGIFTFLRLLRNSIVHPTGVSNITSALVYSTLQQFSYYARTIFSLIDHYSNNKTTV